MTRTMSTVVQMALAKSMRPVSTAEKDSRVQGPGRARGECEAKSLGDLKAVRKEKMKGRTMTAAASVSPR